MESSWKQVFGLHIWEGKSLWLLHNQDVPKRWKDCWSSSNGNLSTNQISAGRGSTNHCDLDINILLCLPPYSRRPEDSMFDKGLHASHGEKLPNHLHVRGNYWALYQEKDGQPVIGSILNCSETTKPADCEWRGAKRTRNQTALLKLKTAKPREEKAGNTMNLGKDIRTYFKPTYCQ